MVTGEREVWKSNHDYKKACLNQLFTFFTSSTGAVPAVQVFSYAAPPGAKSMQKHTKSKQRLQHSVASILIDTWISDPMACELLEHTVL